MYPLGMLHDKNTWDDNRALLYNRSDIELTEAELSAFQPVWSDFVLNRDYQIGDQQYQLESLFNTEDQDQDGFLSLEESQLFLDLVNQLKMGTTSD